VRAGPFWIGPPWEPPPPGADAIVIDPGQAFGTGAHATTRLCVELLPELPAGSFLDVGCGSGVVAIAAARRGFAPVTAVDVDPVAVEATRRNAEVNGVELDVQLLDGTRDPLPTAGTVAANLSLALVETVLPRLDARLVVASGYLERDEPSVVGFRRVGRRLLEGWAADVFERAE
jgi:ribosomal protein L11 methyltransferase